MLTPKPIVAALSTGSAGDLTSIHLLWTLEGLGSTESKAPRWSPHFQERRAYFECALRCTLAD
jgi:hypothetical protein